MTFLTAVGLGLVLVAMVLIMVAPDPPEHTVLDDFQDQYVEGYLTLEQYERLVEQHLRTEITP